MKSKKKIGRPKKEKDTVTRSMVKERWEGQSFATSEDDPILKEILDLVGPPPDLSKIKKDENE